MYVTGLQLEQLELYYVLSNLITVCNSNRTVRCLSKHILL